MPLKFAWSVLAALALLSAFGGGGSSTATTTTATAAPATATGASCTPAGETSAASVNAALAKTYSLKFFMGSGTGCGTACTYAEGGALNVVVAADGKLTIGTLELSSPYHRKFGGVANLSEAIWIDCAAKIEYDISDNKTGAFNEINVGDTTKPMAGGVGLPGFVGQIR